MRQYSFNTMMSGFPLRKPLACAPSTNEQYTATRMSHRCFFVSIRSTIENDLLHLFFAGGPFLPTPTYNPHRRPMVASLQLQPGNFVSLMEIGIDRKIPTRSTTMLFPVSPINAHSLCRTPNNQLSDALMTNSNSQCQLGPSPELPPTMEVGNARGDNLLRLRSRASSEGDLFTPTKPVSDLQTNVEGVAAEELEVVNGRRVIQSSRERRTHRLRRRARMTRGGADGAPATGES